MILYVICTYYKCDLTYLSRGRILVVVGPCYVRAAAEVRMLALASQVWPKRHKRDDATLVWRRSTATPSHERNAHLLVCTSAVP